MIKRMIILIVLGLIFSSCDLIYYGKIAVYENKYKPTTIYKKRSSTNIRNRRVLKRIKRRSWSMMLKRIVMLIVLGLIFSSCQEIKDFGELMGIKDAKNRYEREKKRN